MRPLLAEYVIWIVICREVKYFSVANLKLYTIESDTQVQNFTSHPMPDWRECGQQIDRQTTEVRGEGGRQKEIQYAIAISVADNFLSKGDCIEGEKVSSSNLWQRFSQKSAF